MAWFRNHRHPAQHVITDAENTLQDFASGSLLYTAVFLESADLYDLNNSSRVLIPAPGSGKCITVNRIEMYYEHGGTTYKGQIGFGGDSYSAATITLTNYTETMYHDIGATLQSYSMRPEYEDNEAFAMWASGTIEDGDGAIGLRIWYRIENVPLITEQGRSWT